MIFPIKNILIGCIALWSVQIYGQDLIASQAPIDRRLKATDSVSLQHLKKQEQLELVKKLYPETDNRSVHHYPGVDVPDSFRIDLRHFTMPTPSRNVTSKYGYRPAFRRVHKGLDIKVYTGDTIVSAFSGKVRIVAYEGGGYGKYVVIRHNNGLETVYGHLSKQLVEEGQMVQSGEPIGLGGNTGLSFGSHLHFECLFLGKSINPELMFDFPNQDVTSDYYTFYKSGEGKNATLVARNDDSKEVVVSSDDKSSVKFYKVVRGETLYSIAKKMGMSVTTLCNLNRISSRTKLRVGQILRYMSD